MADVTPTFPTGISGLDAVLGGGLSRRALGLIIGAPGAGKTVLASHILFNAARAGMKALIVTAYSEGNEQYIEHIRAFDFFDPALVPETVQIFTLVWRPRKTRHRPRRSHGISVSPVPRSCFWMAFRVLSCCFPSRCTCVKCYLRSPAKFAIWMSPC